MKALSIMDNCHRVSCRTAISVDFLEPPSARFQFPGRRAIRRVGADRRSARNGCAAHGQRLRSCNRHAAVDVDRRRHHRPAQRVHRRSARRRASDRIQLAVRVAAIVERCREEIRRARGRRRDLQHDRGGTRRSLGGIGSRARYAIKTAFLAQRRDGRLAPAWGRYAGNVVNNLIENAWLPPSATTPGQTISRSVLGLLGRLGGNAWEEFWPDARRLLTKK